MRLEDGSSGVLDNLPQDPVGEEGEEGDKEEDGYYTEEKTKSQRGVIW